MFATTFDTDWDPYVDDALEMMGGISPWGKFLQYCEECPPDMGVPGAVSNVAAKELLEKVRTEAATYIDTFPDVSVKRFRPGIAGARGVREGARPPLPRVNAAP